MDLEPVLLIPILTLHLLDPTTISNPMETIMPKRRYTDEEKRQLIANLDIEVAHRSRQLNAELEIRVDTFGLHQLAQISRIPKQIRNMTMREFGEKYQGDLQSALRGYQKEKLAAAGIDGSTDEIDRNERKRKWVASHEDVNKEPGPERSSKTPRTQLLSPKKPTSTTNGTPQRSQIPAPQKTPNVTRTFGRPLTSPSPHKRPPLHQPAQRPPSPIKAQLSKNLVPSTSQFNPSLASKTPSFPPRDNTLIRLPRKDEDLLSVNGSPLANPYEFGLGWFKGIEDQMEEDESDTQVHTDGVRQLKRSKSSIVIRRDPPVAFAANTDGTHSRTESQLSFYTASSRTTSSTHSRENSQISQLPAPPTTNLGTFRFPSSRPFNANSDSTPRPISHTRSFSALVAIPTRDGQVLEFDPLQTSPGSLDALEGISDSAKKHAKVEMGKLIQATVDKWKIR